MGPDGIPNGDAGNITISTQAPAKATKLMRPEDDVDFRGGSKAWTKVSEHLLELGPDLSQGSKMNIAAIKGGAFRRKVGNLVVLVKGCTMIDGNMLLELKDPTGEMQGSVHHVALNEHPEITIGAVLVLVKVSIFSPNPTKHYLNIVSDNILMCIPPVEAGFGSGDC